MPKLSTEEMLKKEDFNKKLSEMTGFWNRKEFQSALEVIEEILCDCSPEMRAEALLFAGMINQDRGLLRDAREKWLNGIGQASERTYLLYLLQHNIGASYQKEQDTENALHWYREAIQTCVQGDEFSCDQTLPALLSISEGQIHENDQERVKRALEKSWIVLELPGGPDLNDLPKAITELSDGFLHLFADTTREV